MDRVERLIRSASPAKEPLSARAEADLARILAIVPEDAPVTDLPRRPRARWVLSIAAAAVLVLAIGIASIVRPQHAYAATPPMLTITPIEGDTPTVLRRLAALAASQPDVSGETQIITQWWALASEVNEAGEIVTSRVDPIRRVSALLPGGAMRITDYAGQPYDTQGNPVTDPNSPTVGTDLGTFDMDTDERFFPTEPPDTPVEFGRYLADAMPTGSNAPTAHALSVVEALLGEHILTPAQNAALAEYLGALPDLALLGRSTDRLGRPVVAVAAPTSPTMHSQAVLMLNAKTGRIAATETIYRGTDRTDIPSPAVLEYMAWEAP